jgi:hypothetical protein
VIRETEGRVLPEEFAVNAATYAGEIPRRIRSEVYEFKSMECYPAIVISGNPTFESAGRETPPAIQEGLNAVDMPGDEILHMLYASMLGDVFAWDCTQFSNIVNYILPIEADMDRAISSGSARVFDLHTEDAFHIDAGSYLGLFCIRNEERGATIISYVGDVDLSDRGFEKLWNDSFLIRPNVAHRTSGSGDYRSILFGARESPYIRANFNIIDGCARDTESMDALTRLYERLYDVRQEIVLGSGDVIYLDNFRTLHGRDVYRPIYGGSGRWLKRLYISGDIRLSRSQRSAANARIIHVPE